MKNVVFIDRAVAQWKGNLHLHTSRSHDSKYHYLDVFDELKSKGYHFCAVTDHEIYWDSEEGHTDTFITLPGVETILKTNVVREWNVDLRRKFVHINAIKDVTRECDKPFRHDERMLRCYDQGLDCMNEYIRYLVEERGQIVQMNHPDWSHMEPEVLMATQNIFAFEVFNSGSMRYAGGQVDDWRWDYCLERGRKLRATAADDSHSYGPDHIECGVGFTMVSTDDFSRYGIVKALKEGNFYASTGPKIYDMRVEDGVLKMDFSDARFAQIVGFGYSSHYSGNRGRSFGALPGEVLNHIEWKVSEKLNYFRVRIVDHQGEVAWSQAVFVDELIEHPPIEGRETRNPTWSFPRYLDEIKEEA